MPALRSHRSRLAVVRIFLACVLALGFTAVLARAASAADPAHARYARPLPALRLGLTGSLGGVAPPVGPDVALETGALVGIFSAGVGLELRLGVQLDEWLALDLSLFGETALLAGDVRAAATVEFSPIAELAIGLGGGVGSMYLANFFVHSPSADFGVGFLRVEGRALDETSLDHVTSLCFGAELEGGYVFSGALPVATPLVGGRAFGGVLWH
jgi:hypothetical protein